MNISEKYNSCVLYKKYTIDKGISIDDFCRINRKRNSLKEYSKTYNPHDSLIEIEYQRTLYIDNRIRTKIVFLFENGKVHFT